MTEGEVTQGGSRFAPLPWASELLPLWGAGREEADFKGENRESDSHEGLNGSLSLRPLSPQQSATRAETWRRP
jgi:hypothetical protein